MKQTCDDHNLDDPYILRDKSLVGQLFLESSDLKSPRSILVRWRIATSTTLKCFSTFFWDDTEDTEEDTG